MAGARLDDLKDKDGHYDCLGGRAWDGSGGVWDPPTPSFDEKVRRLDQQAEEWQKSFRRKDGRTLASWQHAETKHMDRSSLESFGRSSFEKHLAEVSKGIHGKPKFENGHSIIQWWAPWMEEATEPPKSYKDKNRPAWFKGEVLAWTGVKSVFYAGIQQPTEHTYQVF